MRIASLVVVLSACGGGTLNTSTDSEPATSPTVPTDPTGGQPPGQQDELYLSITSPANDSVLQEGQEVTLSAAATDETGATTQATLQWSAPGWSAQGNDLTVTDLPAGAYDLEVTATSGSLTATDAVSIEVATGPVDYEGELDMLAVLDLGFWGEYDAPCEHDYLLFTIDTGVLIGEGACTVDSGVSVDTFVFVLDGTSDGKSVSGTMVSDLAEGEALTFTGTIDAAGHIEASYDETWESSDGSLQLVGTFWADPV